MAKNYYVILGIDTEASQQDIKSAYRRLAMQYHPDHYGNNCKPFRDIQEAYDVLSDPERRRRYDHSQRSASVNVNVQNSARRTRSEPIHNRPRGYTGNRSDRPFSGFGRSSVDDIFEQLWQDLDPFGKSSGMHQNGFDVDIILRPQEARHGTQTELELPLPVTCPQCNGRATTGFYICHHCRGAGAVEQTHAIRLDIPAGIPDGSRRQVAVESEDGYGVLLNLNFTIQEH